MEEWVYRDIDFSECKRLYDLHEVIKKELELPDFYGRNLSALWDSITGIMATPAYVTIRGIAKLPAELQQVVDKMLVVFRRAKTMYGDVKVFVEEWHLKRNVSYEKTYNRRDSIAKQTCILLFG